MMIGLQKQDFGSLLVTIEKGLPTFYWLF